ncbi:Cas10/Cmr2 second palm domain-containing protein [Paenibacillus sp. NRS-1780]|uniref:Cas10/Cmr2 second palm domain-containing protein n=1 Tax=Paenibacillus sp. NRS-1780 TaxID=3233904 RepID=UPI003D29C786
MSSYVVAVSMDKVQSFLYYVLQAQIQEKQSNNGTLNTIIESSRLISDQFYQDIGMEGERGPFAKHIDEELLKCSGMCVFVTSLPEDQIVKNLNGIFETYYKKLSGQIFMKYVYFKQTDLKNNNPLQAIKESKKRLREKACFNSIIAQNRELLFMFHSSPEREQKRGLTTSSVTNVFSAFTNTINDLYSKQDENNDNHFRVAVIKADLDGMGELFKQLDSHETYKQVSELLSKYIYLEYLHDGVKKIKRNDPEFRLYPLYIAGDDIFFAVPTSKLVDGVNLCKDILKQINGEIEQINRKRETGLQPLSMSIGIDFTFNREPIRYYHERVQQQLDFAKKAPSMVAVAGVVPLSCMKISINEYVLYRYDLASDSSGRLKPTKSKITPEQKFKEFHAEKNNWKHFVTQVKRLQDAMEEGFAAHHFFYGLLNKITDPKVCNNLMKYSNSVLYHVIPQYLNSNNRKLRESELLILESMLKQVVVKTTKSGKTSKEGKLSFGMDQRRQLEKYVRLLLLFADPRFKIVQKKTRSVANDFDIKRVRSTVFNKTLRYLFDQNLGGSKDCKVFREIFVEYTRYTPLSDAGSKRGGGIGKETEVEVYRTLRLSNSLLHRFKGMNDIQRVAEMIEATNPQQKEDIITIEQLRREEHKAPPGLYFDKETFLRMARSQQMWKSEYIDSLLIFYQLREQLIQLRVHPAYSK